MEIPETLYWESRFAQLHIQQSFLEVAHQQKMAALPNQLRSPGSQMGLKLYFALQRIRARWRRFRLKCLPGSLEVR